MRVILGTTAVDLPVQRGRGRPVIQNLGPGDVYIDSKPGVVAGLDEEDDDDDVGLKLVVGAVYEFAGPLASETGLSAVASAVDTDVRIIVMGI